MRSEFYVECYLRGSAGVVKLADLACDHTAEARVRLAKMLAETYCAEDASKIELRARRLTTEDAVGVAQSLVGDMAGAWRAACKEVMH